MCLPTFRCRPCVLRGSAIDATAVLVLRIGNDHDNRFRTQQAPLPMLRLLRRGSHALRGRVNQLDVSPVADTKLKSPSTWLQLLSPDI